MIVITDSLTQRPSPVAPIKHVSSLERLNRDIGWMCAQSVAASHRYSDQVMKPEASIGAHLEPGGSAGHGKPMHFHIVPRWKGDTNFMTVSKTSGSIPEHLKATHGSYFRYSKMHFKTHRRLTMTHLKAIFILDRPGGHRLDCFRTNAAFQRP